MAALSNRSAFPFVMFWDGSLKKWFTGAGPPEKTESNIG
jgi:hypothetical protein